MDLITRLLGLSLFACLLLPPLHDCVSVLIEGLLLDFVGVYVQDVSEPPTIIPPWGKLTTRQRLHLKQACDVPRIRLDAQFFKVAHSILMLYDFHEVVVQVDCLLYRNE